MGVGAGSLELRYEGCFQLGCFAYRRCTKLTWGRLWFGAPLEGGLTKILEDLVGSYYADVVLRGCRLCVFALIVRVCQKREQ